MPYRVGAKGSYGCSGYPALKESTNEVMGCHETRAQAAAQIYAINQSEGNIGKNMHVLKEGDFVMGATTEGLIHGMIEHIMIEGGTLGTPGTRYALESMPPENPAMSVRVYKETENGWEPTAYSIGMMYADAQKIDIKEHKMDAEETMKSYHSENEEEDKWDNINKACWVGYEQRGMKEKDGRMVPNCVPVGKSSEFDKADTYTPSAGMKAAARRALKWKEEGKATGAGTPVGWGRATDIAAGRSMSISVVRRMYSFFSRHEVDKKGKGFYDGPEFPSNGRIMWDAWGGDAGFSWSRSIVEREKTQSEKAWIGSAFSFRKG